MPTTRPEEFFASVREWQWIKHLILSNYLWVWAMKVGSTAREIFVVDAFAGAGTYTLPNGEKRDGSPVIAAQRARQYRAWRPASKMTVICVEQDPEIYRRLEERMAPFGDLVKTFPGDFHDHVSDILGLIGDAPAVVLLDPIGLKAITADRCRDLLQRAGKTDLFVIVHFGIVYRAAGQLLPDGTPNPRIVGSRATNHNVDDFFGGTRAWVPIAQDPTLEKLQREEAFLQLYFDSVLRDRFRFKSAYPVRSELDGTVHYWLVHAGDNEHAYWLMNDSIVKVDELLLRQKFEHPGELPGIGEEMLGRELRESARERIDDLHRQILAALEPPGSAMTFDDLMWSIAPRFFGRVLQGAYSRAVKDLVKAGVLERQDRPGAKLQPHEAIRRPGPGNGNVSLGSSIELEQLTLFG